MSGPAGQSGYELDRLKELLLRPETDRLGSVETRVEKLDGYVGDRSRLETATSDILVDAFRRAEIARHKELANAVAPVVLAAIRNEIKNSKDMMVEALYPITGRLVAAAVANAFRDLVADLNERLDRSLSAHHWKLRFQSLLTGRPVSELALADAQRPALRRLLLLERGSGRLIASWHADGEEGEQSELVSGLIAAITEFASSVYGARSGELRTLDLGGARVFLRGAPVYLVAAECGGVLKPEHEREIDDAFLSLVARIDRQPQTAQRAVDEMAETLFVAPADKKKSNLPLIVLAACALALVGWLASGPVLRGLKERQVEGAFEAAIDARPDLKAWPLNLEFDHAGRTVTVQGLDPSDAAAKALVDALGAAAAPYTVGQRTAAVGAAAQIDELRARAESQVREIAELRVKIAAAEAQVAQFAGDSRTAIDRAFSQAVDKANAQTSSAARDLQSQTQAASDRLGALIAAGAPSDRDRVVSLLSRIAIYFEPGTDRPVDPALAARRMDEIAAALKDGDFNLRVLGQADSTGGEKRNVEIAQARATAVMDMLVARGIDRSRLRPVARRPDFGGDPKGDPRDRRVTFELAWQDEPKP
jgi:outer membrane protein OmpA-like peptidoglycan-associated protein